MMALYFLFFLVLFWGTDGTAIKGDLFKIIHGKPAVLATK